jgi:hypothetical protein
MALSNDVVVSILGAGGLAIGGGLFKLGLSIGRINATIEAIDKRVQDVEKWQDNRTHDTRTNRRLNE